MNPLKNWALYYIQDAGHSEYISALVNTMRQKTNQLNLPLTEELSRIESELVDLYTAGLVSFVYLSWSDSTPGQTVSLEEAIPLQKWLKWNKEEKLWEWDVTHGPEPISVTLTNESKRYLDSLANNASWYTESIY